MTKKLEPCITKPMTMKLIGCVYYGDPFHSHEEGSIENEIGRLWKRFSRIYSMYTNEIKKVLVDEKVAWEAHIQTEEYEKKKDYTVFTGIEVNEPVSIPIDFFYKKLPKTKYAVFKMKGREFITGLDYIYNKWLRTSEYKESHGYMLWRYDEKTKELDDPQSELQAYIPVEEKEF